MDLRPSLFFNFFIILCCFHITGFAQTHSELTERRKQLIREIEEAAQLLASTQKDKATALDQYYAIQRQIQQRQELVETLHQEVDLSTESIERTSLAIEALQSDLKRLQDEYAIMAKQAYRDKISNNQLLFLLSAKDFNDGIKRWRYIQQYDSYRKKQDAVDIRNPLYAYRKIGGDENEKK